MVWLTKGKIAVIPLKEKLVEKLANFSDIEIQEILKFADFLLWQRSQQKASSLYSQSLSWLQRVRLAEIDCD